MALGLAIDEVGRRFGRLGFAATRAFGSEELQRLREFPEISREELFRHFTLTPADPTFVAPQGRALQSVLAGVVPREHGHTRGGCPTKQSDPLHPCVRHPVHTDRVPNRPGYREERARRGASPVPGAGDAPPHGAQLR
ncbi:hypothetical protein CEJ39_01545 [Rhodococcus pyridinivorans]|nr:hypothetical protein CEJ39_01545 [Rhodococcus pyridinivorans]